MFGKSAVRVPLEHDPLPGGRDGQSLPSLEEAKARLAGWKGHWASLPERNRQALLDQEGPELLGPQEYVRPS